MNKPNLENVEALHVFINWNWYINLNLEECKIKKSHPRKEILWHEKERNLGKKKIIWEVWEAILEREMG